MSDGANGPARPILLRPARPCPICGRKSAGDTYPFCSKRCADVDLNRWLSNSYVVPSSEADERDDERDQR